MFEDTKRGNQNPYISKKNREHNGQKDKQWSTKHAHKAKDFSNTNPTKNWGWTRGTCGVDLVTKPVISHEWGKDQKVEHIGGLLWHRYSIRSTESWFSLVDTCGTNVGGLIFRREEIFRF